MPGQADEHGQDVKDHRRSWAGHLQYVAQPRQQVGSQKPLRFRYKPPAKCSWAPGLPPPNTGLPWRSRDWVQLPTHLYLDDIMSGQLRWRPVSFFRTLSFCLFCWGFFILVLVLLALLAGHQSEHQCSMVPREGAVEELLREESGGGKRKKGSGQETARR